MFEKIINRGTLMTVIVGIVVVLGIVATLQVPVQMIPDLDVRTVQVRNTVASMDCWAAICSAGT